MEKYLEIISSNVRQRRLKANLSQGKLAKLINKSTRFVTTLETTPKDVQLGALIDIADALKCDPLDLLGANTETPKPKGRVKRDPKSELEAAKKQIAVASKMAIDAFKKISSDAERILKEAKKNKTTK